MKIQSPYQIRISNLVGGIAILMALSLAVGTLFSTRAVLAGEQHKPKISSSIDLEYPQENLSPKERRAISLAASRILRHVDAARRALMAENDTGAKSNIDKAETLVRIIDKTQPVTEVKTHIQAGDESYQDVDFVRPGWITLSDEVSLVDIITPVVSAKADRRGQMIQAQPSGEVKAAPGKKMKTAPKIAFEGIEYSTVQFNVNLARDELTRASIALSKGDRKIADLALASLQSEGVLFSTATADLPLHRASANLSRAKWELDMGNDQLAKSLLTAASNALEEHVSLLKDEGAPRVKNIRKEIDQLAKTLSTTEHKVAQKLLKIWTDEIDTLLHS